MKQVIKLAKKLMILISNPLKPTYMKHLILLALSATLLVSCQKKPTADFTMSKENCYAGEAVSLTNTTKDGYTYKWSFPDGTTNTAKNIDFTPLSAGDYTIKLSAYSRKGKYSSDASHVLHVVPATGQITVWTSNGSVSVIDVTVDGSPAGTITQYFGSYPGCAATGCVTGTFSPGIHTIAATDGTTNWNGSLNVSTGACSSFELQ